MKTRLLDARNALGLSQEALAHAVGVTTKCYQNYEYGLREPRVSVALKIAEALNADVHYLFKS